MESFQEVWEQVLEYLKGVMSETSYKMWIETLVDAQFTGGKAVITATTDFKADILRENFTKTFDEAFENVIGIHIDFSFVSLEQINGENSNTENGHPESYFDKCIDEVLEEEKIRKMQGASDDSERIYRFDNFIVGSSNKLAHAASWRVATAPIGSVYNPLFIYGNSGLGKTHLMKAIQNEMKKRSPFINIVYTTSENFVNEFISCMKRKDNFAFREKYRTADALFIDDIQFIKKKLAIQEEFFHTFNDLINAKKQIVITSDRPPKEIEDLDDRIKSRFESGLIADIQPPDLETRTAIIIKKAEDHNLTLSKQIVNYIAEKIKDNIRQIEGTITKISAMETLYGISPTLNSIQEIIRDIETDNRPVSVIVDEIIESVADKYDLTKEDIVSEKRNANIALARNVSMYVIREVTGLSLENIGAKFGGKKHSTVKHSIDNVEEQIQRDVKFKNTVYNIVKEYKDS